MAVHNVKASSSSVVGRLAGEVQSGKHVIFRCCGNMASKPKIADLSRIGSFNNVGKGDRVVVLVTKEQAEKCYKPEHAPSKEGQRYFIDDNGFIAQSNFNQASSQQFFFVLMTGAGAQEFFKSAGKPRFLNHIR
ncbi:MAG: hypothetical protein WC506_03105 [Candidatus Micrarchaeia archaeon]